jgi:signal transduction histidine kinase/CheY-like chemotaxis protein
MVPGMIALVLPLAVVVAWKLRHRGRPSSVASRVAVAAAAVVSLALGAGILTATGAVIEAALEAALPETRDQAMDLAASAERVWPDASADPSSLAPLSAVARGSRPYYTWIAILRLDCRASCLVAHAGGPDSAVAEQLGRIVAGRPNRSPDGALRIGDHLTVAARAAIRAGDGRPHALAIVATNIDAAAERARRSAWRLMVAAFLIAGAAWLAVRRLLVVTVADRLNRLTERLGERHEQGSEAPEQSGDELEVLSGRVEAAIRRSAELEAQLERGRKIEALGRLSGGIAHDFNNLLTVIGANAALLRDERSGEELDAIETAARRGASLVRKLLAFGRPESLNVKPAPIGPLLHEAMALVRRVMPESIELAVRCEVPDAWVTVDRAAFEQIVLNLATNARDAMPRGGRFEVEANIGPAPATAIGAGRAPDRSYLGIRFTDTGSGMGSEDLNRVFEPFFTTKPPEQGSGLGLAIVHGLVRRQGGWVEIASRSGVGTVATVYLATTSPEPERSEADELAGPGAARPRRLLLVEDEGEVRRATARALRQFGCLVDSAANGSEAEAMLARGSDYELIVSDVLMPVMGGLDLTRAIRARGIMTPVLLVSGYSLEDLAEFRAAVPNVGALGKPWSLGQLAAAIEELIDAASAPAAGSPSGRGGAGHPNSPT